MICEFDDLHWQLVIHNWNTFKSLNYCMIKVFKSFRIVSWVHFRSNRVLYMQSKMMESGSVAIKDGEWFSSLRFKFISLLLDHKQITSRLLPFFIQKLVRLLIKHQNNRCRIPSSAHTHHTLSDQHWINRISFQSLVWVSVSWIGSDCRFASVAYDQ